MGRTLPSITQAFQHEQQSLARFRRALRREDQRALDDLLASSRRHLAAARQSVIAFIRQLLEARREELQVTDVDLAAFIVVSAAEGIGANVSEDLFGDPLADEVAGLLALYLTGEKVTGEKA